MKAKFVIILCLLFAAKTNAQDTLSFADFNRYSYKLPATLIVDDSFSIKTALTGIASLMYNDVKKFTEKPLRDTALLKDVYDALIYGAIYREDFSTALFYIDRSRKLFYRKKYTIPIYILEKAFAQQKINTDKSKTVDKVFEQSIMEDISLIDHDFIKDAVNQAKGSYSLQTAAHFKKDVTKYLAEAFNTDSTVIMYNMPYVMGLFFRENMLVERQTLIQQLFTRITPEKIIMQDVRIPMRDGISLGGMLFRNMNEKTAVPVIISQSPYPQGNEASHGNIFAINGYAYLYVDCRGRRSSEGIFFPYENDARDYYDIIDWASKQRWCNGKVATTGGSYLGFSQWQAIRKQYRHPALKAINPMAAVGFGVDFPRSNQTFYTYILQWAMYVQGKELNSALFDNRNFWNQKIYQLYKNHVPFSKFDSVAGVKNEFFTKWIRHPDFDNYWKNILPKKEDYQQLDIPVLTTTGYFDADQLGALFYYHNHVKYNSNNKHYVIMGPFDHPGSQWMPSATPEGGATIEEEAQIPLYKYVIQWFDWALKGKPLPSFFKNKVNYFATGEHTWKSVPSLQKVTNDTLRLYLTPHPVPSKYPKWQLTKNPDKSDNALAYQHDIFSTEDSLHIFVPASITNTDSFYNAFNSGLQFESPIFEKEITVAGSLTAHLFTSLNVPDADIEVDYTIIDSNNNEIQIADDVIRTRYRNSAEHSQLMTPGKPSVLNFSNSLFKVFKIKADQKFRMYIIVRNNMYSEKNYGYGGEVSKETTSAPRMIETKVYTGKDYPSYIALPVQ